MKKAVNLISGEALRQGSLSAEQAEQNASLASETLTPETAAAGEGPRSFIAGDLALILRDSGISFSRQDPGQLRSAASYLNDAADLTAAARPTSQNPRRFPHARLSRSTATHPRADDRTALGGGSRANSRRWGNEQCRVGSHGSGRGRSRQRFSGTAEAQGGQT